MRPLLSLLLVVFLLTAPQPGLAERLALRLLQTTDIHMHLLAWDYSRCCSTTATCCRAARWATSWRASAR